MSKSVTPRTRRWSDEVKRKIAASQTHHGMISTTEYRIWKNMKTRCLNPNNAGYRWYGARGIKVCERWMKFENFFADMGKKPAGMSLDRINNDGDYEPSNCRWATLKTQANNMQNNLKITYNGETKGLKEWAQHIGLHHTGLKWRLTHGWSVEKALTQPNRLKD